MECGLRTKGRLFFPSLIAIQCAKAGVVAFEEEEQCKVKLVIDLGLIKKLQGNLAQKKSRASTSKSAQLPTMATLTSTRSRTLRPHDVFSPLELEQ